MAEAAEEPQPVAKKNPDLQAFKDKIDAMDDEDVLQNLVSNKASLLIGPI